MMNLLMVLGLLFVSLALVVKLLDGRAKPLSAEQQQRLSTWLMVAVMASLVIALLRHLMA